MREEMADMMEEERRWCCFKDAKNDDDSERAGDGALVGDSESSTVERPGE